MPNYKCLVRGDNYPGELFDSAGLVGFHTNIYVRALNTEKAEHIAMDSLRNSDFFKDFQKYERDPPASVTFEKIVQIEMMPRSRSRTLHSCSMDEPDTAFMRSYNRSSHVALSSKFPQKKD